MVDPSAVEVKSAPVEIERAEPRLIPWHLRAAFLLCGLALTIGFFLPWATVGTAIELTGAGLVFSGGDVVQALSGSGRFILFLVPLLGVGLVVGAVMGHRATPWVAALGAGALLVFGVINVILLFISTTGLGMWMVVFASLGALTLGVLSAARRS